MTVVDPTSAVADGAALGNHVTVGPCCVLSAGSVLGDGVHLLSNVVIDGLTSLGPGCTVYPFAALGTRTQDLKYRGGRTRVEIGARTTIREGVTVNAATADGQVTRVGSDCLLMAGCHVAHNCRLEDGVIMANNSGLAGDVQVGAGAVLGGLCGVHQYVRLGRLSFCGGCSKIVKDIPPFMLADGNPARVYGLNVVGLRRRGLSPATLAALKRAFRILYREGLTLNRACDKMFSELGTVPEAIELIEFARASRRGLTRGLDGRRRVCRRHRGPLSGECENEAIGQF